MRVFMEKMKKNEHDEKFYQLKISMQSLIPVYLLDFTSILSIKKTHNE